MGVAVVLSYPIPEIAVMIGDKILTGNFNQEIRLVKKGNVQGLQVGELVEVSNMYHLGKEYVKIGTADTSINGRCLATFYKRYPFIHVVILSKRFPLCSCCMCV